MRKVLATAFLTVLSLAFLGGGFSLAQRVQAAPGGCEGGWELQCDGNVCCTVCQGSGEIGDCEAVN